LRTYSPLAGRTAILRADVTMTRGDRMAVGLSMQDDGFTARDIARIVSLRWKTIVTMRRALGLPPLRRAGAAHDHWNPSTGVRPRSLELAVRALSSARMEALPDLCIKLQIGVISGYGIRRAIDYSLRATAKPTVPTWYRCAACEQITPTHPCANCGATWLAA
jgi:hypothetical protein